MRKVALCGKKTSGKSTVAEILTEFGFQVLSFATPLKKVRDVCVDTLNLSKDEASGGKHRELLKSLGLYVRQVKTDDDKDPVIEYMRQEIDVWYPIVIDDLRMPQELEFLRQHNFDIFRVCRPGLEPDSHITETALDHVNFPIIENNGTRQDLEQEVLRVLNLKKHPAVKFLEDELEIRSDSLGIDNHKDLGPLARLLPSFNMLDANTYRIAFAPGYNAAYFGAFVIEWEAHQKQSNNKIFVYPHGGCMLVSPQNDKSTTIFSLPEDLIRVLGSSNILYPACVARAACELIFDVSGDTYTPIVPEIQQFLETVVMSLHNTGSVKLKASASCSFWITIVAHAIGRPHWIVSAEDVPKSHPDYLQVIIVYSSCFKVDRRIEGIRFVEIVNEDGIADALDCPQPLFFLFEVLKQPTPPLVDVLSHQAKLISYVASLAEQTQPPRSSDKFLTCDIFTNISTVVRTTFSGTDNMYILKDPEAEYIVVYRMNDQLWWQRCSAIGVRCMCYQSKRTRLSNSLTFSESVIDLGLYIPWYPTGLTCTSEEVELISNIRGWRYQLGTHGGIQFTGPGAAAWAKIAAYYMISTAPHTRVYYASEIDVKTMELVNKTEAERVHGAIIALTDKENEFVVYWTIITRPICQYVTPFVESNKISFLIDTLTKTK